MIIDIRTQECVFVTIGNWEVCLDNSTGEQVISTHINNEEKE
jgi:hypothetical protein